jgi:hypothetical protein
VRIEYEELDGRWDLRLRAQPGAPLSRASPRALSRHR